MYTLGERIRHTREKILRLNQSGLANKLGFSRVATISDYETNKRLPDITTLRKIASCAGVSLEWLLTGKGPVSVNGVHSPAKAREISSPAGNEDFVEVKVYGKDYREGAVPIDGILIPKKDFE
ncbi:MAG: helix-turn-helix transcriptional regulator, partial [Sedimentisphaerales bacterium]|nr:helix-turn-helix transcriptional regulator [Sedimentisphaerales bacterium]